MWPGLGNMCCLTTSLVTCNIPSEACCNSTRWNNIQHSSDATTFNSHQTQRAVDRGGRRGNQTAYHSLASEWKYLASEQTASSPRLWQTNMSHGISTLQGSNQKHSVTQIWWRMPIFRTQHITRMFYGVRPRIPDDRWLHVLGSKSLRLYTQLHLPNRLCW